MHIIGSCFGTELLRAAERQRSRRPITIGSWTADFDFSLFETTRSWSSWRKAMDIESSCSGLSALPSVHEQPALWREASNVFAASSGGSFAEERMDFLTEERRVKKEEEAEEDVSALLLPKVPKKDFAQGFTLRATGRYAHTKAYIEGLLAKHDLKVISHESVVSRKTVQGAEGLNVTSQLVVAEVPK
mmetsp:Transcript_10444/g.25812  ORF Transcript_10444/g.25812 Transcript_10444/m.25812 type:complete len:188 (+) Transcript_10444:1374-1937(+)